MKDLLLTLLHLTVMTARLCGPGGVRAVIAENLLLKQQLIVLRRPRQRAPHLTASDRLLFGFGSLFLSPERIRKVAIGVRLCSRRARSPARDRTITWVKQLGRCQWQKASGYHRQSRVENAFFRYKSIIGDGLRARSPTGQGSEVVLGCAILNRMTELGRPVSYRIGR